MRLVVHGDFPQRWCVRLAAAVFFATLLATMAATAARAEEPIPCPELQTETLTPTASGALHGFLEIDPDTKPRYGIAALEIAGILGAGTGYYFTHHEWASADWDLELGEWGEKVTLQEGTFNLDTNDISTNFLGHPVAGMGYCFAARHNGMSFGASYATCAAASTLWEFGTEAREQLSVNDFIVTPMAGMALSEPLYRALEYSKRRSRTGVAPPGEQKTSAVGEVGVRTDSASSGAGSGAVIRTGIETELRLGEGGVLAPGEWTRFTAKVGLRDDLSNDLEILSQTAILGYYRQRGATSFLITGGNGFHLDMNGNADPGAFATVQVLGSHLVLQAKLGETWVRLGLDVSGDFAQVTSLALAESSVHPSRADLEQADSIVRSNGTYYSLGITAAPSLVVGGRDFEAGVSAEVDHFSKLTGMDRYPDEATAPIDAADTRAQVEVRAEWRVPGTPAWIGVSQEWGAQAGQVEFPSGAHLESTRHTSETLGTVRVEF